MKFTLFSVVCLSFILSGCDRFTSLFSSDLGEPLQEFQAEDSKYFPEFITDFFKGAKYFVKLYPALSEARSDVRLIDVKRLNEENQQNESNLSWSADGVYLSFEKITDTHRQIQIRNLAGNYEKELSMAATSKDDFLDGVVSRDIQSYNSGLSWSTDSTRFAFMSNGGVGVYDIYVGAVGVKEKPIVQSPAKDGYAKWSPVKNEIVFVSGRTGGGDIYLKNLDNNKLQRLSFNDEVEIFPEWFPNGKRIAYFSGSSYKHSLYLIEQKENGEWNKPRRLTDWSRNDIRPTISPNGELIAFYSSYFPNDGTAQKWNIHVIPLKHFSKTIREHELGSTIVASNVVVDLNTGPAWTPDSRKIFYVKNQPEQFNPIAAVDLFTGRRYVLKTNTKLNRDILVSNLGVLSFRAQVGAWEKVFVALTNQGKQLQNVNYQTSRIHYEKSM